MDFKWDTEHLLKLRPGARVKHEDGFEYAVLKAPALDPDWAGGWRVFLEDGDNCLTAGVASLDPESITPPELPSGTSLIRYAHEMRAEREILLGQIVNTRREILEEVIKDLQYPDADVDFLIEKYEGMLEP